MNNLIKRIISTIILLPLILYLIINGSFYLIVFLIICFLIACYEWHRMIKNIYYKTIGFSYLAISFYVFHKLSTEIWSVLFIISICVLTDIGGYTFGKLIGGPKLTNKS